MVIIAGFLLVLRCGAITHEAHTQTATVNVKEGFAGRIYDAATAALDPTTGILSGEKQQFQTDYNNYTTRITAEQTRLDTYRTQLQAQFSAMETTYSQNQNLLAQVQKL